MWYAELDFNVPEMIMKKEGEIILGGGFKHLLFSPLPGDMIQVD